MWYLCENVKCQRENKKQVKCIKIFIIPGQSVQLQVSHKCSLSMQCSRCFSMKNPAAIIPGWGSDGEKKPESALCVHFCFRRKHFVPIASAAYFICQRAKIWPSLFSGCTACGVSFHHSVAISTLVYVSICTCGCAVSPKQNLGAESHFLHQLEGKLAMQAASRAIH